MGMFFYVLQSVIVVAIVMMATPMFLYRDGWRVNVAWWMMFVLASSYLFQGVLMHTALMP